MKCKDVFSYYKKAFGGDASLVSNVIASRLGVTRQYVDKMKNRDLMYEAMAYRIERDTRGALTVSPTPYGWSLAAPIDKEIKVKSTSMRTENVFDYYQKAFGEDFLKVLSVRLGIQRQRINYWKGLDFVPENIAYRIQCDTRGVLKVNPSDYGWILAPEITK